jgi:hypothetical protein
MPAFQDPEIYRDILDGLPNRHGSIIGIIQTFEEHFALAGPDANNQSMKEHGWLDEITGLPNQAVMQSHLRFQPAYFADRAIHRKKGRRERRERREAFCRWRREKAGDEKKPGEGGAAAPAETPGKKE